MTASSVLLNAVHMLMLRFIKILCMKRNDWLRPLSTAASTFALGAACHCMCSTAA
jgi:hypothetical protein